MYVITFYSFKGGVGRTFALVNVAAELARMGRKVLLVDFDLEAPGLETFDRLRHPRPHPGVVEYVKEYLSTKQSPDVRDYTYSAGTVGEKGGELLVMPAGRRDAKYQAALASIDWKRLYHDCQGYWFFEDTKNQWEEAFKPDYVLIDSRTGHTDVEGICTRQLPQAVVVLFFPNEQNLVGLKDVCRRIRREKNEGLKKLIWLYFVAANVPDLDDEDRHLRRHLDLFREKLEIPHRSIPVIHHNESLQMLNQPIFVLERPYSRLAKEYRRLTKALRFENPEEAPVFKANLLSQEEDGIPRAAQMLRDFIAGLSEDQKQQEWRMTWLGDALLKARCYDEIIEYYHFEHQHYQRMGHARLILALAYWGRARDGILPEETCIQALEWEEDNPDHGGGLEDHHPEGKALFLWRTGNVQAALEWLDKAEKSNRGKSSRVFSWWRCRRVSVERFLEDCQLMRRMFQGEPLRPQFLRSPPS